MIQLFRIYLCCFFFFNDTATTEIYTLSLHDALPISEITKGIAELNQEPEITDDVATRWKDLNEKLVERGWIAPYGHRSEEHTSELQSRQYLVCRLLLEKKKK